MQTELKKATGTEQIVQRMNFLATELSQLRKESPTALKHTMAQLGFVPSSDVNEAVAREQERMYRISDTDDRDIDEKIRHPRDFEM